MGVPLKMLISQPTSPVVRDKNWQLLRKIDAEVEGETEVGYMYEVTDDWKPKDVKLSLKDCSDLQKKPQERGPVGVDWDAQPLGDVPDAELAEKLGVSKSAVLKARQQRGIKGTRPPRKKSEIDWDAQPLGEVFDSQLARELGVDAKTVQRARNKRGIKRKYVDWDVQPLGEVSDSELARKLGVDRSTVSSARRNRGIATNRQYKKIDWTQEPLGKIPDSDVARALGVSQSRVTRARNSLGIPACKR